MFRQTFANAAARLRIAEPNGARLITAAKNTTKELPNLRSAPSAPQRRFETPIRGLYAREDATPDTNAEPRWTRRRAHRSLRPISERKIRTAPPRQRNAERKRVCGERIARPRRLSLRKRTNGGVFRPNGRQYSLPSVQETPDVRQKDVQTG